MMKSMCAHRFVTYSLRRIIDLIIYQMMWEMKDIFVDDGEVEKITYFSIALWEIVEIFDWRFGDLVREWQMTLKKGSIRFIRWLKVLIKLDFMKNELNPSRDTVFWLFHVWVDSLYYSKKFISTFQFHLLQTLKLRLWDKHIA